MSRHPSFGKSISSTKKRNVLKRFERIDILKKQGKFDPDEAKRVTRLPKTRVI